MKYINYVIMLLLCFFSKKNNVDIENFTYRKFNLEVANCTHLNLQSALTDLSSSLCTKCRPFTPLSESSSAGRTVATSPWCCC